jgi:benzoyl-CoA-dihydrodiol lyase
MRINFNTDPEKYKHWKINFVGKRANLIMDVSESGGLFPGYELKLNSYDLGVDIELHDALQRLRFEHPEVQVVVLSSGKPKVFCAGANIKMLGGASHGHKVNFCKFTNETRNSMEDANDNSGQRYVAAVGGACAGGGYELALATDHIILIDDGSSGVSLPEVALLAVLPGTGGITRVTDKRKVRRDRADIFCATEEGVRGNRALEWNLVDELASPSLFEGTLSSRVESMASASDRPVDEVGVTLNPIKLEIKEDRLSYSSLEVDIKRAESIAELLIKGPKGKTPANIEEVITMGDQFWPLRLARELDDAVLQLRFNEEEIAVMAFNSIGSDAAVKEHCDFLEANKFHWLIREIILYWTRVLKRVDLTSKTIITKIEPGSCFVGFLAELVFAADRSFMADGVFDGNNFGEASLLLTAANFGRHPMSNQISRLATRFLSDTSWEKTLRPNIGIDLKAEAADDLGLITAIYDEIDWEEEIRLFVEERVSFSPDALTGLEANTRFAGPETMETKIFGRLTAWQNWIFQRANAVGEAGALSRYGSGKKVNFDRKRV